MGAPPRRRAGRDPALRAGPLAQRRPGRRHRPRRGVAANGAISSPRVSQMTSVGPAAFPPDAERCARTERWFAALRDRIATAFEAIEDEFARERADRPAPGRFE